jgi:hypothetical protein
MKFRVRNKYGELGVTSFAELRTLYLRQFISDDDEILRDGTDRWVKAGLMPDLRTAKPHPYLHGNEFAWLAVAICIGTLIMIFLMRFK